MRRGLIIFGIFVLLISLSFISARECVDYDNTIIQNGDDSYFEKSYVKYSSVFVYEYPEKCCEGLTEFESGMDTRYTIGDKCYETGMESGNPVGICINCGNGICEDIEDICSCPEDCPNGENSAYTIESFCEDWEISSFKSGCDSGYIVDFESGEKLPICDLC